MDPAAEGFVYSGPVENRVHFLEIRATFCEYDADWGVGQIQPSLIAACDREEAAANGAKSWPLARRAIKKSRGRRPYRAHLRASGEIALVSLLGVEVRAVDSWIDGS